MRLGPVGDFFFMQALFLIRPAKKAFTDFFKRLRDNTLKVLEYQDFPLELICSQLKIKYPTISVFFNMVNIGDTHREQLTDLENYHMENIQDAKFDMVYYLTPYKNGIEIICHYFKHQFKPETIEKIMQMYKSILENILDNPKENIIKYSAGGKKRKLIRSK